MKSGLSIPPKLGLKFVDPESATYEIRSDVLAGSLGMKFVKSRAESAV